MKVYFQAALLEDVRHDERIQKCLEDDKQVHVFTDVEHQSNKKPTFIEPLNRKLGLHFALILSSVFRSDLTDRAFVV